MSQAWEKVLWKKQTFPDNYVDPTFMSQLRTNATADFPSAIALVLSSLPIAQQLASVLLFVGIFTHIYLGGISAATLVWLSIGTSFLMAALGYSADYDSGPLFWQSLPSIIVLSFTLHALSPMVRTFSEATTSDSVWAFTAILFLAHCAFSDYAILLPVQRKLTTTVSLSMAMCASVVLSSRLMLDVDVFALLLVGLQLFAIFPLLRDRLYKRFGSTRTSSGRIIPHALIPLTMVLVSASILTMAPYNSLVAYGIAPACLIFVCILCPLWMHRAQQWKTELRGPWDEAVVAPYSPIG